ncbi:MAG: hypothetical protein IJX63_09980 [Lachnospiraceae bacterium]|nr:hypothetical protein [Lachnospiraceae bacterium]
MKLRKLLCIPMLISILTFTGCSEETPSVSADGEAVTMDYSWVEDCRAIAHAFGGIEEYTYTNSLEAFLHNYEVGHRFFEVDFMLTTDNVVVAAHDWDTFYQFTGRSLNEGEVAQPLTLEQFQESKVFEKFTPLTWKEIATLMQEYPDIYIVTDTKYTTDPMITTTFTQFVKEAQELDGSILERIIPQIYNNEMYDIIYDIYPWKSVIYTLYNQTHEEFSYDNVYKFIKKHDIKVVTTFPGRADMDFVNKIHDMGGSLYLHTFNDAEAVESLIEQFGIQGVYTDFLTPEGLEELFE